jgi:diadenosine tetraphosphate (Ap4A) HIT family hydrolase
MLGRLEKLVAGEVRNGVAKMAAALERGAAASAGNVASEIGAQVDTRVSAAIADYARHFRLTDAPRLVAQLQKLDDFWGADVTREIARDHLGHRGGFIVDTVANAERRGYPDLKGLQESIPSHWLSRAPCPFCHPHEQLAPKGSIVAESENFVAAPNIRQLFALEGEKGGHVMFFARHHRSTPGALPDAYKQELVETVRKTKKAMEDAYGEPVSLFANGMPGAPKWLLEDVDSHAHMQLFSGNTTVTEAVLRESGLSRDSVIPVNGFDDYFRLYEQGKLRGKYILTLDADEKGHVILLGDYKARAGLAMRNARISLGLTALPEIRVNEGKAGLVTALVKAKLQAQQADAPEVRKILASAPLPVK